MLEDPPAGFAAGVQVLCGLPADIVCEMAHAAVDLAILSSSRLDVPGFHKVRAPSDRHCLGPAITFSTPKAKADLRFPLALVAPVCVRAEDLPGG